MSAYIMYTVLVILYCCYLSRAPVQCNNRHTAHQHKHHSDKNNDKIQHTSHDHHTHHKHRVTYLPGYGTIDGPEYTGTLCSI